MKREVAKPLVVSCAKCNFLNVFNQPYRYHAGFSDQGFLYSEGGNCTLIWSCFDPAYEAIVGSKNPWALIEGDRAKLEESLLPAPDGSRWLFRNPARCTKCKHQIGGSITETIYYLEFDGSINTDLKKKVLKTVLKKETQA
jgi:hypothetical protein